MSEIDCWRCDGCGQYHEECTCPDKLAAAAFPTPGVAWWRRPDGSVHGWASGIRSLCGDFTWQANVRPADNRDGRCESCVAIASKAAPTASARAG